MRVVGGHEGVTEGSKLSSCIWAGKSQRKVRIQTLSHFLKSHQHTLRALRANPFYVSTCLPAPSRWLPVGLGTHPLGLLHRGFANGKQ